MTHVARMQRCDISPFPSCISSHIVRAVKYDPGIHHRRSIRLPHWDYSQNGAYFVTICTHGRACLLDDATFAAIVEDAWRRVAGTGHGPGEFVVMPNHVHDSYGLRNRKLNRDRP